MRVNQPHRTIGMNVTDDAESTQRTKIGHLCGYKSKSWLPKGKHGREAWGRDFGGTGTILSSSGYKPYSFFCLFMKIH